MARPFELLIYACIFIAAVISGLQSYKVDSEYEHATWAIAADFAILILFMTEISEYHVGTRSRDFLVVSFRSRWRALLWWRFCLNSVEDLRRGQQISTPFFLGSLEHVRAHSQRFNLMTHSSESKS